MDRYPVKTKTFWVLASSSGFLDRVSAEPPMELDLDSFLRRESAAATTTSSSSSDDDDDLDLSIPQRTVDDILNDSDSSSSPSSPSPTSSFLPSSLRRPGPSIPYSASKPTSQKSDPSLSRDRDRDHDGDRDRDHDAFSVRSASNAGPPAIETLNEKPPHLDHNSAQSKYNLLQRFKSDEFHAFSDRRPPQRSSMFGSIRSTAKPGAALAAAVAASRSIPTPYAAAIKLRRASSVNLDGKVSDADESLTLGFGESYDVSDVASVKSAQVDLKSQGADDRMAELQSAFPVDKVGSDLSSRLSENRSQKSENGAVESFGEIYEKGLDGLGIDESRNTIANEVSPLADSNDGTVTTAQGNIDNLRSDDKKHKLGASANYADWDILEFIDSKEPDIGDSGDEPGNSSEFNHDQRSGEDSKADTSGSQDAEKIGLSGNHEGLDVGGNNLSYVSDDVNELVEDRLAQLENERAIKRMEKKLLPPKKPLELAEELEKRQASTGLHWEEGAMAQPMRLEGVRRGSTALGYFDIDTDNTVTRMISSQAFRRDHGSAQSLAVHQNYIALGMSKGVVLVVPSKYSVYHPDDMEGKVSMLGLHGDRSQAPVTSLCFTTQGDLLLAGYGDGRVTFWDVPRATSVRVIAGEHTSPVVYAFFLGQSKAVTGDSKGLVLLHKISVMPLIGRYTFETQRIFDGINTSIVVCASPLPPDEFGAGASVTSQGGATGSTINSGGKASGATGGYGGWKLFNEGSTLFEEGVVVFVNHQAALVVRLTPTVQAYPKLFKPDGVREGSMPYTAWKSTIQSHESSTGSIHGEVSEKLSLLAIAWDRKVQVARFTNSGLNVFSQWTLGSAAVGLTWLDDQMLVVLTSSGQICLFERDGTLIHQTSYAVEGSRGDDLIAYHTHFTNIFGNPEKAYHNFTAIRGASIYVLGPMHLIVARLLPWKERIQVLRKAGDGMGALNMAMTLYDGQAHGVIDLPRGLDAIQDAIMPYLVDLIISYVDEVFSYISVACFNRVEKVEQPNGSEITRSSIHYEIKDQFTRVGGVAVEFCVHIKRTDVLFDDIFSKFLAVQQKDTFLELLEPYILKDMLGSLPPEVMQALVEHYNSKGWLQRVEQCVLHMDISSLDFNQVVRLCQEHGLYGALIYLFNKGLDDFRTPLEELLSVLRNSERDAATTVGYRMLIYLKYCFLGLAFPPGRGTLPSERVPSLKVELLQFLLEDSGSPRTWTDTSLISSGIYLKLYYLLELDTGAVLDVLRFAFVDHEVVDPEKSIGDSSKITAETAKENDPITESQNLLLQKLIDALVLILDVVISQTERSGGSDDIGSGGWPLKKDIGCLIEFITSYVASERASVPKSVLGQILEYLTSVDNVLQSDLTQNNASKKWKEKQVLALLYVVPETDWNASYVLHLCEKAQFYQVCGLIHSLRQQYLAALDSYMKDEDEPVHAFSFINNILLLLSQAESVDLQSAIISRIPELTKLSRECTFFLVLDRFIEESEQILSELQSHPKSLFLYLKTVIEVHLNGTLDFTCLRKNVVVNYPRQRNAWEHQNELEAYLERIAEFPKLARSKPVELTDEIIELYLELLCQFEPDSVLKFLETFESYRVEPCLRLCQEYGIIDAAAFLLERGGDVGNALQLTLSGITNKFIALDAAVESMVLDIGATDGPSKANYVDAALRLREVKVINNILHSCIGLCQRNTPGLDPQHAESLWFLLLDSFCKPLMLSELEHEVPTTGETFGSKDGEGTSSITWKICKTHNGAPILKRLFAHFIKEIVEGMIGYIGFLSIMSKLLFQNSSQEFGDFKLTILGILGRYGFERRILDTAKSLIEDDTFYTMSLLKKGASHGYAPRSVLCCICSCPFSKTSSTSGIRVFSCGHAAHLQCELQENDASSRGTFPRCPICMPKRKIQSSRSKTVELGLVPISSSRHPQAQGPAIQPPHEGDAFEYSRGLNQISRFDMLSNLEKNQKLIQIETLPQLRLAPPPVYHEKIRSAAQLSGERNRSLLDVEAVNRNKQARDLKGKGPAIRFPLRSKIFGKEKTRIR
ncbi:hypothetical protein Dimus_025404 [Dionaea muscipula]